MKPTKRPRCLALRDLAFEAGEMDSELAPGLADCIAGDTTFFFPKAKETERPLDRLSGLRRAILLAFLRGNLPTKPDKRGLDSPDLEEAP